MCIYNFSSLLDKVSRVRLLIINTKQYYHKPGFRIALPLTLCTYGYLYFLVVTGATFIHVIIRRISASL